jgi:ABC-type branched-subunit amino acid transport system ATPase component
MSAYYKGFVSPFDLSIAVSADVILMVILGGTGTLIGPVIGAIVIVALRNFLSIFINHWLIILGLIFILTVFIAPNGVVRWFSTAPRAKAEDEDEAGPIDTKLIAKFAHETDGTPMPARRSESVPDLALQNVTKLFGGMRAVDGISLDIFAGKRVALLGPNGAGKTSLFHLISGLIRPSSGRIYLFGQDVSRLTVEKRVRLGIGRTFQITNLFLTLTVLDNIRLALFANARRGLVMYRSASGFAEVDVEARELLSAIGLWHLRELQVQHLSYGHRRQLEVVMALALRPMLLLLDEPTAGLSASESAQIVRLIKRLDPSITLLVIEHDMDVALQIAEHIVVLHHGQKIAEGPTADIRANPKVREIYLGGHGTLQ